MTTVQKLLSMKERLDSVKIEHAKIDGLLEDLGKRLKDKSGSSDIKKAKSNVEKIGKVVDQKESDLEKGVKELEDNYEW